MKQKSIFTYFLVLAALGISSPANAAPKALKMSGKLIGGAGRSVLLVLKNGVTSSAAVGGNGSFVFKKVKPAQLKGASLQLIDNEGHYAGPVVLRKKGAKVSTTFSGKTVDALSYALGKIDLKSGYAVLRKPVKSIVALRPTIEASNGKPVGAGELGLVATAAASAIRAQEEDDAAAGGDSDLDGVPNAFDVDDDGDLTLDASDPNSRGSDIPFTGLVFDFRRTLNEHVRGGLTDEAIDAVVSGENVFSLTFFFSQPEESTIDGGYVICDDSLIYCKRNDPVAFYGGVSESTEEFRNKPWSDLLNEDGYPRMERISVGGRPAIVASIQPRVGRTQFAPGDVYQVQLTSGSAVTSSRSLALAPYFVSIPAIKEYDAGFGAVQVDYNSVDEVSGSIPGIEGNPIVLSSDGLLTLHFWRPQRAALRSDESGYYDWGNLNYGLVLEQAQATCGGLYTGVTSDLVEDSTPLGNGDSPLAQNGANLSPLRDQIGDRAADSENLLTFTVDLKTCTTRAGLSAGTYRFALRAAGEDVTGGQISAVQSISVQVP